MPHAAPIVATSNGRISGLRRGKTCVFRGIPYGAATGGKRRFLPPAPPSSWTDVREATNFGNTCPQNIPQPASGAPNPLANLIPADPAAPVQGEDCLVLNVWTQSADATAKRPVMVWFHGGYFTMGSGSSSLYDGARLSERGNAVIVTVNHRLNVFGFLDLSEVNGADVVPSGNVGMLDLIAALQWVRDNIAHFGGDPTNVTIFGESGGGAKVCTLLAMPGAKGLFHKAIIQSGPYIRANLATETSAVTRTLMSDLGVRDVRGLQEVDAKILVLAAIAAEAKAGVQRPLDGRMGTFAPMIDGVSLLRHPFDPDAPEMSADVPLMIGTTKDEITGFMLAVPGFGSLTEPQVAQILEQFAGISPHGPLDFYKHLQPDETPSYRLANMLADKVARIPSALIAKRKAAQMRAPVYSYMLAWETRALQGVLRSTHALDIPLVFDNIAAAPNFVGPGAEPQILADYMSSAWLAFAERGVPDAPSLPSWPAYTAERRGTMVFDMTCEVIDDLGHEASTFWAANGRKTAATWLMGAPPFR